MSPGGKGANQAVAAARMGAAVSMIGTVGADEYGQELVRVLEAEGVDITRVGRKPGATGVATITVAEGGANTIIVAGGANLLLSADDVRAGKDAIAAADVLLIQLEIPLETALQGAAIARDTGTTVVLNASPMPDARVPSELLAATDVLVVNETEARSLAKSDAAIEALLEHMTSLGPRCVVITMGEQGAKFSFDRVPAMVEAFTVEAIDTVGAGDAFVGVLSTRWAELQIGSALDAVGVLDAVCWGAAAGALATLRAGAISSLPRRRDVVDLLRRFEP